MRKLKEDRGIVEQGEIEFFKEGYQKKEKKIIRRKKRR